MKPKSSQVNVSDLEENEAVETSNTIRDELKCLWYEYCSSATIHGIGLTGRPRLYAHRKTIWTLLVLAMAIGLGFTLNDQLKRLADYPIKTKILIKYVDQIDFPAVTICNLNQFRKDRVPDNLAVRTLIYYSSEFSRLNVNLSEHIPNLLIPFDQDVSGEELHDISQYAAHRLDELFLHCEWKSKVYPCEELFAAKHTNAGTCYTFNGNESDIRQASSTGPFHGLRVILNTEQLQYYFSSTMTAGVKVVIDQTGMAPFPDREGWSFRPGVSASVALSKEETTGLPHPYRAFGNRTCLDADAPSNRHILKRYNKYKLNACISECLSDYFANVCNCTKYNDPGFMNGTTARLCSVREMLLCYLPTLRSTEGDLLQSCSCPWKCKTVSFRPAISYADISSVFLDSLTSRYNLTPWSNYLRSNAIDLNIFFDTMGILKTDQEPEISVGEIVGTLGGQMGLFLGASILSIIEITEIAALFFYRSIVLLLRRLKKKCNSIKIKTFDNTI